MIPNNLFYVWFGKRAYPQKFQVYKKSWEKYSPGFKIIEINETNFNVNMTPFTQSAYKNQNFAFVSDFARVWALNKYGGIYIDTDVELLHNISFLLQYHQFWAEEDAGMVNTGLIFGSEPEDAVLSQILSYYGNLDYNDTTLLKQITTVKIVSNILKQYGLKVTRRNQNLLNKSIVFGPEYFAPFHYWGGGHVSDKTVSIHHYEGSWTSNSSSYFKYLMHQVLFYIPAVAKLIKRT